MPPKRGAAKQEEEEQRKAEEEAALQTAEELRQMMAGEAVGGKVDPTMAMFAMMQRHTQRQEAPMQHQMEMLTDRLTAEGAAAGGGGHGGAGAGGHSGGGGAAAATRSRKMEAPRLKSPEDTTLAVFRDWKERFTGYATMCGFLTVKTGELCGLTQSS